MAEKKMTKKDMFNLIMNELSDNDLIVEFCEHEIELLNKKATKPSKADKEKDELANKLYDVLAEYDKGMTISELIKDNGLDFLEKDGQVSTQRVSAYMKKLVDCGKVEKYTDKKKTYFKIAE